MSSGCMDVVIWFCESSELELRHLIGDCVGRVCLLALRMVLQSGNESVKRHV